VKPRIAIVAGVAAALLVAAGVRSGTLFRGLDINKDATLTGTAALGIDLTHANTWTGAQTFFPSSGITTFVSSGSTRGQLIVSPMTSDPSGPSSGEWFVSGTTTAMHAGVTLNGTKQGILTGGANGARATQAWRQGSVCTTAASVGASCSTAATLPAAYPDTNYTVVCVGDTGTQAPVPSGVSAKTTSGFNFSIVAVSAAAATFSSLDCIAIHD
jgi:hypothetical protein